MKKSVTLMMLVGIVGGCGGSGNWMSAGPNPIEPDAVYPVNYKSDLLDFMRTELVSEICTGRYVEFLPDSGHAVPSESGDTMTRRPRRNHTPAFKEKVALAAIKGDRTLAQLTEQFDVHPNQITSWKAQLECGGAYAFDPESRNGATQH